MEKKIIEHGDLAFSRDDTALKMSLFLPEASTTATLPCVLVIQGGGFRSVDGKRFRPFAEYLARNGYAAALISYRGRPEHQYDTTIADCKTAVRYVRSVADKYNIDPERIGAMGRSAGGTLAALLALTGGEKAFEGEGGHGEYSSRIQAAVSMAGVYDFIARFKDKDQLALMNDVESRMHNNFQWIGEKYSPESELWRKVSPVHHVDKKGPPLLLLHSKNDATVPWLQSKDMLEKCKAAGMQVESEFYAKGGHSLPLDGPEDPLGRMVRFFDTYLKGKNND